MNAIKGISMKGGLLASGALLAMFAFAPYAKATSMPVRINFSGAAGSGYVDLTLGPDTDSSSYYQPTFSQSDADHVPPISPPLSPYDPFGAEHIIGASGSFTSGGSSASITGIVPTSPGMAPPGETLPKSFSWFTTGDGTQYSYDNLFYADGSPLVCPPTPTDPYVFYGGYLDIFGAMFSLDNGDVVALWSDGVTTPGAFGPGWPGGLTYGINVFTQADGVYSLSSSQFAGATATVPEPNFLWLFGAGVVGLFAWRRSATSRRPSRAA